MLPTPGLIAHMTTMVVHVDGSNMIEQQRPMNSASKTLGETVGGILNPMMEEWVSTRLPHRTGLI
jgi:hypothetical protein